MSALMCNEIKQIVFWNPYNFLPSNTKRDVSKPFAFFFHDKQDIQKITYISVHSSHKAIVLFFCLKRHRLNVLWCLFPSFLDHDPNPLSSQGQSSLNILFGVPQMTWKKQWMQVTILFLCGGIWCSWQVSWDSLKCISSVHRQPS